MILPICFWKKRAKLNRSSRSQTADNADIPIQTSMKQSRKNSNESGSTPNSLTSEILDYNGKLAFRIQKFTQVDSRPTHHVRMIPKNIYGTVIN